MPTPERYEDLEFPLGGVNLLAEFQEQPPGTCADAENVRAQNPDSLRERGGSRAGLARYCANQIPADLTQSMVIQHLAMIVDPQAEALNMVFIVPDDDWIEDPLNPGTFVPPGGSGNPPNPNATQPPKPSAAMTINVILTPNIGPEDVTLRTITDTFHADSRTGSAGYTFSNLENVGADYDIQCDNDVGVYFPSESKLDGVHVDFGSSGNNLVVNVPWTAGSTHTVEFIISFG